MKHTCELCGKLHKGSYGSGRFCSSKCARSFSTSKNREEISKKVSEKLKGRSPDISIEILRECGRQAAIRQKVKYEKRLSEGKWEDIGYDLKRRRVLKEQKGLCDICELTNWNGKSITLRFDHIDGDRTNNTRSNCRMICPNCDSQLSTYCGRNKRKVINKYSEEEIFNCLKKHEFIRYRVVKEMGLASGKNIYKKLKDIQLKYI